MITISVKIALRSLETVENKGFLAPWKKTRKQDFSVLKRGFEQADFFRPWSHFPTFSHFPPLLPLFSPLIPHFPPLFHLFSQLSPTFAIFTIFLTLSIVLLNTCIAKQQKLKQNLILKINFKN